jgi:hypothetical protein
MRTLDEVDYEFRQMQPRLDGGLQMRSQTLSHRMGLRTATTYKGNQKQNDEWYVL